MITGKAILDKGFIKNGCESNLKNSTYDITVSDIFPVGKDIHKNERPATYFLEPREMVWVLSKEEFELPNNVTGLATLRTSYTRSGLLALNVGIIDPMFSGPISTALINFSDRPRRIDVGDKFFRIAFIEHDGVSAHHPFDESVDRLKYIKELETASHVDFSPSFMNIPAFDDEYYAIKLKSIIWAAASRYWKTSIAISTTAAVTFWYLLDTGLWGFLKGKFVWMKDVLDALPFS